MLDLVLILGGVVAVALVISFVIIEILKYLIDKD